MPPYFNTSWKISQAKAAWCDRHLAFWSLSLSLKVLFDNLSFLSFWVCFQAAHPRCRAKQLPLLHLFPSFKKIEKAIATCFLPLMPISYCCLHRSNLLYCFIICYACQQAASWFPWVFSINPAVCIAQWLPNHNRISAPLDESWRGCPHLLAWQLASLTFQPFTYAYLLLMLIHTCCPGWTNISVWWLLGSVNMAGADCELWQDGDSQGAEAEGWGRCSPCRKPVPSPVPFHLSQHCCSTDVINAAYS